MSSIEKRDQSLSGIQREMENLLKVIGSPTDDQHHNAEENMASLEGVMESDEKEDDDDSVLIDLSYLDKEVKSLVLPDLSIFGTDGQLLFQDIVDGDLTEHDEILNVMFQQSRAAARLHLIQIKTRLIGEKESALHVNEQHNLHLLQLKNKEMQALQRQLALTEDDRDRWITKYDTLKNKIPEKITRSKLYMGANFSVLKVFSYWKQFVSDNKKEFQLEKFADLLKRRSMTAQTFARINRENARSRLAKLQEEHKVAIDKVTKQIVEAYESDLHRFRTEASEAHVACRHEQLRRKQLEEDLRRMLLKNMTAMNFEALSLFQHTTMPTPHEQMQTVGDLKDMVMVANTPDMSCIDRENIGNTTGVTVSRATPRSVSGPGPGTGTGTGTGTGPIFSSSANSSYRVERGGSGSVLGHADPLDDETPRRSLPTPSAMSAPRPPSRDSASGGVIQRSVGPGIVSGIGGSQSNAFSRPSPIPHVREYTSKKYSPPSR